MIHSTHIENRLPTALEATECLLVRLDAVAPLAMVGMIIVLNQGFPNMLPQHRGRDLSGVRGVPVVCRTRSSRSWLAVHSV